MTTEVLIKKLNENAVIPTYGTEFSAGADLYVCEETAVTIAPGETKLIHTGIALQIPDDMAGFVYARSGLATKKGLAPANKVGVIDSDYRGEIMVSLYNQSNCPQTVETGERVAQLVIAPYVHAQFTKVDELSDTVRGGGGFGSTGQK